MFYRHVSNCTEHLLEQMSVLLRVSPQRDIFSPELFLIQSQGMERLIIQTLADNLGTICNYRFLLPLDFLKFIANSLGIEPEEDSFSRELLAWRIDGILRELDGEVWQDVREYLSSEQEGRKRFQLAWRLANVFDEYQLMRPEMLSSWEEQKRCTDHAAEGWQSELWRRLLAQPGGEIHRGELFHGVISRLQEGRNDLPQRISIFGINTMPPLYLRFLRELSETMDIHFFVLSPSRSYLGELKTRRGRLAQKDPFSDGVESEKHHPLLESLGILGRDFQEMMLSEFEPAGEFESFEDVPTDGSYQQASLLRKIQIDLLENRAPEVARNNSKHDNSVTISACHSRWRELEVLKDFILQRLEENKDLEPKDIVVMAPDIQEYDSLIPTLFASIPHSVSDRSQRRENSAVETFLAVLELIHGRFGWNEMFDVLRRPLIAESCNISQDDFGLLQHWIIGAGIRWGMSADQRRFSGLYEFGECSWRAGLDRMLMGYCIDTADEVDNITPYCEIEGGDGRLLGGLCQFVDTLDGLRRAVQHPLTPVQWGEVLLESMERLFQGGDADLVELRQKLMSLMEPIGRFHDFPVDFGVIRDWLMRTAQERRVNAGFLDGRLTFCSMLPMRSIPFKVVCLLGLDDAVFPAPDRRDTFDLMAVHKQKGDRSARLDDRYQFLEAILAARQFLYMSYLGRSRRRNEEIPPSVVLTEFIEVLHAYGVEKPVIQHPLHNFSKKYFDPKDPFPCKSYSDVDCKIGRQLQQKSVADERWEPPILPEPPVLEIQLDDILQFFSNPQLYFLQQRMELKLNPFEEMVDECEVFRPDNLQTYMLGTNLLQENGDREQIIRMFRQEGQWPLESVGALHYGVLQYDVERFRQDIAGQEMGEALPAVSFQVEIGKTILKGRIQPHEQGYLAVRYGKLRGKDLLSVWIMHLVGLETKCSSRSVLITRDGSGHFDTTEDMPRLEDLVQLYLEGRQKISQLYPEIAFAYAQQTTATRARVSPLSKARGKLIYVLENGYDPALPILARGRDADELLGEEFEQLCHSIMIPIWRQYAREV